ncbi:glycoside hydrolase family 97 protein [Abyssalbus ytuae]|uniref:Glycoside hydrolase family 97 protein n=1 Tax=Abyssalbus ytuae TaxID=2926907 RepID=A0A9E6ZMT3_9FLAO|nr:glycoside hydrolase family 97 protein [Abyssalbus ytuae]UOB18737.1 glycoside hydrolase family 97 protein [Abyssalbus ytuae]
MINRFPLVLMLVVTFFSCQKETQTRFSLVSPEGKNIIHFELKDSKPYYSVSHGEKEVLTPSRLGFVFQDNDSLAKDFKVINVNESSVNDTWNQVWGEKHQIQNHYNQLTVTLQEKSNKKRKLNIEFRAFDDGVAFRYIYPEQESIQDSIFIMNELTEFNLKDDGDAWWIPAYKPNRYEHLFTKTNVSEIDTVHTPFTIKSNNGLYLSFHEADLKNYASYTVAKKEGTHLDLDLMPWHDGVKVRTTKLFKTPWRTLQIGEKPGDLIESYLILNLNEPNKLDDLSYIETYKYTGIWWGMHISKYTFWEGPKHGASTKNSLDYIDMTNQLGIHHMLVEGWNKGWTPAWYENKMHEFSFTEATPDFDYQKVVDYAKEKGVKIIGYHETGSNIINYKKQIDAGMQLYKNLGIHDVKIGQVGDMLNMKEWHGSQFGVQYYRWVLEKAAQYQLTVNFHEPIKATGERRTYPNMMAREGARGQEYNAWSEGNPPNHTVILPFTRMLSGPMDFTPGILDIMETKGFNNRRVHTTAAKQLALYVVFYSPIQMLADLPENYIGNPAFRFLTDVPTDWEDTKVLNAEIGEYITTVRKDLKSKDWYLGSITNEKSRELEIDLSFLENGKYEAQIYADASDTTLEHNPEKVDISKQEVTAQDKLKLKLATGGGTAIRFKKL